MKFFKSTVFLVIGVALFLVIQEIMTPDWSVNDNANHIIRGFKAIENSTVEVLYLGSSVVEVGVSPMQFYQDTGICTYSLATVSQPLSCSYFILKEAFKTQSPSVVVLDASALFWGGLRAESDYAWRVIMDNLDISPLKIEMAEAYEASSVTGEKWNALFPIIKYHTRWTELTEDDLINFSEMVGKYYSAGQFLNSVVAPAATTENGVLLDINHLIEMEQSEIKYIDENGIIKTQEINSAVYNPVISEYCRDYLLKIKQLCEEHGTQLLLIKVPQIYSVVLNGNAWTESKYHMAKTLTEEYGLPFLDLKYDINAGVDFTADTSDGGIHLNIHGAEKVTLALEAYLLQNYDFMQQGSVEYDEALEKYTQIKKIAHLQTESTFNGYMEMLYQNLDNWTILVAAKDNYVPVTGDREYTALSRFGLQLIDEGKFWDSYVAVIHQGNVMYEAVSDRRIDYSTKLGDSSISMFSSGWYTVADCSIEVNGKEYAAGGSGLNIVVLDNQTGLVIDSVTFGTAQAGASVTRPWSVVLPLLRAYESAVCFE